MKSLLLQFVLLAGLSSCHDSSTTILSNLNTRTDKGATQNFSKPIHNKHRFPYDTLTKSSNYIFLGDSLELLNADTQWDLHVRLKFKPYIRFTDLPAVVVVMTTHAPIQYSSNKLAYQYRTIITETYHNEGINFGGHYCFVKWGCGSDCQYSALVDVRTGIVYEGVDAARGYAFRKNSQLLIASPPDSTGFYGRYEPRVYAWNERKKKFEQRD